MNEAGAAPDLCGVGLSTTTRSGEMPRAPAATCASVVCEALSNAGQEVCHMHPVVVAEPRARVSVPGMSSITPAPEGR